LALQQLNANLERQVQERTSQLQQALDFEAMLKRITDKVRDSLDESQILQTAVEELAHILHLSGCIALYNLSQALPLFAMSTQQSYPRFKDVRTWLPEIFISSCKAVFPVLFNCSQSCSGSGCDASLSSCG